MILAAYWSITEQEGLQSLKGGCWLGVKVYVVVKIAG